MIAAGRDRGYMRKRADPTHARDGDGSRALRGAAVAELSDMALPPGDDGAVGEQGDVVKDPGGDRAHAGERPPAADALHRDGGRAVGRAAVAQLPILI